jgi:hypothetical protein
MAVDRVSLPKTWQRNDERAAATIALRFAAELKSPGDGERMPSARILSARVTGRGAPSPKPRPDNKAAPEVKDLQRYTGKALVR